MEEKIKTIEKLTRDLIKRLELEAEILAKSDGQNILLDIQLDDPAILIGKGGQTMADLQHLIRMIINRKYGEITYLSIDVNSYRQRQQDQVEEITQKTIDLVRKTNRSQLLSPMPAISRKMAHLLVKEETDLETQSIGDEPNRRVLIKVKEV